MCKTAACLLWCLAAGIAAQSAEFEVASVKQLDRTIPPGQLDLSFVGTSGKRVKVVGNRITFTGTLRVLMASAYDIKDYQISAAPAWAGSLLYNITAKTPGETEPTEEQVRPMLQALLADRFQLKTHRETKELPVYRLVQTKKVAALKPAEPGEVFSWNVTPAPNGMIRSKAVKISMGDFVQLVGVSLNKPLIDKTGLSGYFDYEILFPQDEVKTQDDANPSIINAVKDQLGLKMENAKEPIDLLVVDHIEKPSGN
jgi:uncharacterized protein (TIGR03435 family)